MFVWFFVQSKLPALALFGMLACIWDINHALLDLCKFLIQAYAGFFYIRVRAYDSQI